MVKKAKKEVKTLSEQEKSRLFTLYKKTTYSYLKSKKTQGQIAQKILDDLARLGELRQGSECQYVYMISLLTMAQQRAIEINTKMIQDQSVSILKKLGLPGYGGER